MIDHVLGRPSPTLRRSQIILVLSFWLWRLYKGDGSRQPTKTSIPRPLPSGRVGSQVKKYRKNSWLVRLWVSLVGRRMVKFMAKLNDNLQGFTPSQLILGTFTFVYALRHFGDLFGLGVPEPLGNLYTRSFYRATYINTALDAGFSSAMTIKPKWLKDLSSVLFSAYYMIYVQEGDEVLRRFRALCTVEMLRVTWEKTKNPYIRLFTIFQRPALPVIRDVLIPRPKISSRSHLPPIKGTLFFNGSEADLAKATQLVVDFPGGGFVAMGPDCHEERLRRWAKRTGKPILGINYGKAPEYPYPWAIEEGFDAYRTLMETRGRDIGISSGKLGIVLTGDSAGGNICTTIMLRILEHPSEIPRPTSIILAYPALDFNFTSWMSPANLRVLRTEQSETHMPGIINGKDHMRHKSPLAVVDDVEGPNRRRRQKSWSQALGSKVANLTMSPVVEKGDAGLQSQPSSPTTAWTAALPRSMSTKIAGWLAPDAPAEDPEHEKLPDSEVSGSESDSDGEDGRTVTAVDSRRDADKSLRERVKTPREEKRMYFAPLEPVEVPVNAEPAVEEPGVQIKVDGAVKKKKRAPVGTRLTMTSRVGYFQDKIISPSMMRAMAILYIGPHRNPDFETDYYISPILSPPHLLAHFPPVYLICGERDPFVDDTIIFAGKVREAKRHRRAQAERMSTGSRHGEGLRMTLRPDPASMADRICRETDEDWVNMRIIEGWGHGFMQMSALMKEVDSVLVEMADWIDESFAKATAREQEIEDIAAATEAAQRLSNQLEAEETMDLLPPDQQPSSATSSHVKPVRQYKFANSSQALGGGADLGAPFAPDLTPDNLDGEEGTITFTPKSKKKRPPPTSKFNPVPRRRSKENLEIHRSSSVPRFDFDESGSSGETVQIKTPTWGSRTLLPGQDDDSTPKGSGAFAFFNGSRNKGKNPNAGSQRVTSDTRQQVSSSLKSEGTASEQTRRASSGDGTRPNIISPGAVLKSHPNALVAAAVAGARAASPALAAAGLVPEKIGDVSEVELMRRRRMEAVFGIGETDSDGDGDSDDDD